jgi:hypothetical protein
MAKRVLNTNSVLGVKRVKRERPQGPFADLPGDMLQQIVVCEPCTHPALYLVSRAFHEALDRPIDAIWYAYYTYYTSKHYGYSEWRRGEGQTWRDHVRLLPTLRACPCIVVDRPATLDCGFLLVSGVRYHPLWVCPTCRRRGDMHKVATYSRAYVHVEPETRRLNTRPPTVLRFVDYPPFGYSIHEGQFILNFTAGTITYHRSSPFLPLDVVIARKVPTCMNMIKFIGVI